MWMCAAPGLVLGVLLAPAAILTFVLATLPLGMRLVLPSLWLLGAVFQRTLRTALLGPVRSDKFAMRMAAPAEAMSMTSATRSGETVVSARSRHARSLFAGIAMSYERVATLLSLGQDPAVAAPPRRIRRRTTRGPRARRRNRYRHGCPCTGQLLWLPR